MEKLYRAIVNKMELLKIENPLLDNLEYVSEWIQVENYKKIRISSFSDTILLLNLEWTYSLDGKVENPLKLSGRTPSGIWKSELYDNVFSYLRIRVINQSGKKNELLAIIINGVGKLTVGTEIIPLPSLPIIGEACDGGKNNLCHSSPMVNLDIHDKEEDKKEKKHRNFFLKKRDRPLSLNNALDSRLPGFITCDSLLVGKRLGKVGCLPKGNVGEILQMTADGPQWALIYPPLKLSDESKKKLGENKEVRFCP